MQRFSKNRQAILDCLCSTKTHPTAEWIYTQLKPSLPSLSLATVYRNLTQLRDAGLICSVNTVNGQERFDANVMPHTHAVCGRCGCVIDVPEIQVPTSVIGTAQEATGYRIRSADLRFTGLCAECAETEDI